MSGEIKTVLKEKKWTQKVQIDNEVHDAFLHMYYLKNNEKK